ncbi:conserved hypothetical protein. probable transmembrane protein [Tenacibaculum maritimum]|nr:conserved hypothetical protein. probable transmembrane protein [Tenacibaculum maritimum]CAA0204073.1 conserved hypothetical protein. probable transmembrane protein [Tenacibaculum maritimum]
MSLINYLKLGIIQKMKYCTYISIRKSNTILLKIRGSVAFITYNIGFLLIFLFLLPHCFSQQKNLEEFQGKKLVNRVRLNFIPVQMPTSSFPNLKNTMGLMGLHYQVPFNEWLYGGAAIHSAITGDQGGLFTLGIEVGIHKHLFKNLYFDTNFHFGGGGGYRYLVNDGAFINTNLGLQYKKKAFSFGVQYSHLNFYSGKIKSNSISLFLEIPSILRFTDYQQAQKEFINTSLSKNNLWKRAAIKNAQQVRFDFFFPFGNSRKDNANQQAPLRATLYVIGFEYQKYMNEEVFLFAHTDAIYKGLRAGFMDLFFGAGYRLNLSERLNLFGKLGIGAAGGRIAPEGGLMMYPSAGINLALSNRFSLSSHGGYYRAITGDLEAYTLGFGLKYTSFNGGTYFATEEYQNLYTQGIRIALLNQSYFKVAKTDAPKTDLQLLAIQLNYDINNTFYVIGEAGFAYKGKSGGYAHGLVGIGLYSPRFLDEKLRVHLEGMIGAAGGAGVDTGEGIVIRPSLGISYHISPSISLFSSIGKMVAPFGNMNTSNINAGLSFELSTLSASK